MTMQTEFTYQKPVEKPLSTLSIGDMFLDPLQISSPIAPIYLVASEISPGGDVACMVAVDGQDQWTQSSLPGQMSVVLVKNMALSVELLTG